MSFSYIPCLFVCTRQLTNLYAIIVQGVLTFFKKSISFWLMFAEPEFFYKVLSCFGQFTSKTRTAQDVDGDTTWNEVVAVVVCEPDLESLEVSALTQPAVRLYDRKISNEIGYHPIFIPLNEIL